MTDYETIPGEQEIWRGKQWAVTTFCIQAIWPNDYWVEHTRLHEVRPGSNGTLSDWMLHLAEKGWVDIEEFIAAWCIAVALNKPKLGKINIQASIDQARKIDKRVKTSIERRNQEAIAAGYQPGEARHYSFCDGELVLNPPIRP